MSKILRIPALLIVAVLCLIIMQAVIADTAFRSEVEVVASAGELELAGTHNELFHAFKLEAITFGSAIPSTQSVTYITGNITNALVTFAVTNAANRTYTISGLQSLFKGDKIRFAVIGDTNTISNFVTGREE